MKSFLCFLLGFGCIAVEGQEFRNFGFDDGNTANVDFVPALLPPQGLGSVSDLLPGWTLKQGSTTATNLLYNEIPRVGDYAAVFDLGGFKDGFPMLPRGKFAFACVAAQAPTWELTQTGQIPAQAHEFSYVFRGSSFQVWIDNQLLQPTSISGYFFADFPTQLKFDISAYAGRVVTLKLLQIYQSGALDTLAFDYPPAPVPPTPTIELKGNTVTLTVDWVAPFELIKGTGITNGIWNLFGDPVLTAPPNGKSTFSFKVEPNDPAGFFRLYLLQ